jgi:DNA-binding Lrp family transcriptional regulator
MAVAFVLVKARPGHERGVRDSLARLPGIVELHSIFGEHDLLAKVEAPDYDALGRLVSKQVRVQPGIEATHSLTVMVHPMRPTAVNFDSLDLA